MKLSILMPTYNDEEYIATAIQSVLNQDYDYWELIIINDGSLDNTQAIVARFEDRRIRFIEQENGDQLNALLNGSQFISGDLVMLLHSDDVFLDNSALSRIRRSFLEHPSLDGVYADIVKVDADGRRMGAVHAPQSGGNILRKYVLFNRGDNYVGDVFAVTVDAFNRYVKTNYLVNNCIYYIIPSVEVVLRKIGSWYGYRISDSNYINSAMGMFVQANGCFRTIKKMLTAGYSINPLPPQSELIRKIVTKSRIVELAKVRKSAAMDVHYAIRYYSRWKHVLASKRYPELAVKQINKIIQSLECHTDPHSKILDIKYEGEPFYQGKDARLFYRDYEAGNVKGMYRFILEEEYTALRPADGKTKEVLAHALDFFSFYYPIIN